MFKLISIQLNFFLLPFFLLAFVSSARVPDKMLTNPVLPLVTVAMSTVLPNMAANVPTLSLFMHDILGGSAPSVRVVAGLIATTQINAIPFSKPNGAVFPIANGIPLVTANNGIVKRGNFPLIAGLNGGSTTTVISANGNNNVVADRGTLPFVKAGQLPIPLQSLVFGTITVIDDELTEGHELGSAMVGRAQGFYLASSLDGTSHTMAFTALLHHHGGGDDDHDDDDVDDTISFFGVHRTAGLLSPIAVVGGTGKYENAKGHAMIEAVRLSDQHITDGVDTILHLSVFLS